MAFTEREPEHARRSEEHTVLEHAIELEVRLDLRFVEIIVGLANALRIELPVPWLERVRIALLLRERAHTIGLGARFHSGSLPDVDEQSDRRVGRLGHLIVERVRRRILVAEQTGALRAKCRE